MSEKCLYLLFLIWFSISVSLQILLFSNGFLLSKETQQQNSSCTTKITCVDPEQCYEKSENASGICYKQDTKVVLLIIDALRYDFTVMNHTNTNPLPYENKLPIIDTLLSEHSSTSRLFKFIADPPTTTMQRIKALTTGTLPTFIDAGSNFATHEINEDNIIDQLLENNYSVVFMGDDTWTGLYPQRFTRNYPYPSFNVWDLDTVDDGVITNLFAELKNKDWKLLIGHFLGVDHCGHRYGPNHPEMARKLSQMNTVIEKVISELDDEAILFVIGDHGMTSTGDHGGESENEITSALFVHSKQSLSGVGNTSSVKQLDLVPTLSNLLGIPIPFSNLGATIFDCLPLNLTVSGAKEHYMRSNAQQLMNYMMEYSKTSSSFNPESIDAIYDDLQKLESHLSTDSATWEEFYGFVTKIRELCETIWIKFDAFSMARGLLLLSHLSVFTFLLVNGLDSLNIFLSSKFILFCYILMLSSILCAGLLIYLKFAENFANLAYFLIGLPSLGVLVIITVRNFQKIAEKLYESSKKREFFEVLARVVLVFSALMLFSNSFILEESKVTVFLLLSLIITRIIDYFRSKYKTFSLKTIAKNKIPFLFLFICIFIRISVNFWQCREEQGCNNSIFLSKKNNANEKLEWLLATLSLATFVVISRICLKSTGNLNGFSANVLVARYAPVACSVITGGFWVLHKLPDNTKIKLLGPAHFQVDALAWAVYLLLFLGILTATLKPLFVCHLNDPKNKHLNPDDSNLIPQLAKKVFQSNQNWTPIVYGLATVYTSAYLVMLINFVILWCLIMGPTMVPSCLALISASLLYIVMAGVIRLEKSQKVDDLAQTSFVDLIVWYLMSLYVFYGVGNQPAFPNISWDAAFVGFSGQNSNKALSALLVLYNTFGSYFLMGFMLPLLLLNSYGLHVIAPGLVNKRLKEELARGEMSVFEHEELISKGMFKICINYLLCHLLRMFSIMLSSTIHCRHLMVWNIFAPKFIFEGIAFFVTSLAVALGYAFYISITKKLSEFIDTLSKNYN